MTVTATLADGYAWGTLPAGVDVGRRDDGDVHGRRWSAASCDEVTPVAPTVTQAVCRGWGVGAADVDVAGDDRWDHLHDVILTGRTCRGQQVTVTATLDDAGVGWPATLTPMGWTRRGPTTATYPVTFIWTACVPAVPVDPVVTQATCANGVVTVPTVVPAASAGGHYALDPAGSVDAGHGGLRGDGDGDVGRWLRRGGRRGVDVCRRDDGDVHGRCWSAASCDEVTPVAPTVTQAVCRGWGVGAADVDVAGDDRWDHLYDVILTGPYVPVQRVDGDGDVDDAGVGVAAQSCPRGGRDASDDGDVSGDVHLDGVCAGGSGGSDGDAGDVYRWCGDGADGGAGGGAGGGHLRARSGWVRMIRHRGLRR